MLYYSILLVRNSEFLSVLEGDSEALLPYSSIAGSLSNQDKQLFKTILKQIINTTGQVNKEIFANKEPLFVGKNSKNINMEIGVAFLI